MAAAPPTASAARRLRPRFAEITGCAACGTPVYVDVRTCHGCGAARRTPRRWITAGSFLFVLLAGAVFALGRIHDLMAESDRADYESANRRRWSKVEKRTGELFLGRWATGNRDALQEMSADWLPAVETALKSWAAYPGVFPADGLAEPATLRSRNARMHEAGPSSGMSHPESQMGVTFFSPGIERRYLKKPPRGETYWNIPAYDFDVVVKKGGARFRVTGDLCTSSDCVTCLHLDRVENVETGEILSPNAR